MSTLASAHDAPPNSAGLADLLLQIAGEAGIEQLFAPENVARMVELEDTDTVGFVRVLTLLRKAGHVRMMQAAMKRARDMAAVDTVDAPANGRRAEREQRKAEREEARRRERAEAEARRRARHEARRAEAARARAEMEARLEAEIEAGKRLRVGSDVEIAAAVAEALIAAHCGHVVADEGAIWAWSGTHWLRLPEHDIEAAIARYDGMPYGERSDLVKLNWPRVRSCYSCLLLNPRIRREGFFSKATQGINCSSGFVRLMRASDGGIYPRLEAHHPDHRARHCLSASWDPELPLQLQMRGSLLERYLEGSVLHPDASPAGDGEEKVALLQELAGAAALGLGAWFGRAALLYGPTAGNGKSQFVDMLRGLLPPEAVAAVAPARMADERYVIELQGKALNALDEIRANGAIESDAWKTAVDGGVLIGRRLYRDPISFRSTALHVYGCNRLPSFEGGVDRGVQRRVLVIEFNRSITMAEGGTEVIEAIGRRIAAEEATLLLAWAVAGAVRLASRGDYTVPRSSRMLAEGWVADTDPVAAWFAECCEADPNSWSAVDTAYRAFRRWAMQNASGAEQRMIPGKRGFGDRLLAAAGGRVGRDRKDVKVHGEWTSKRVYKGLRIINPCD